jgi:hypothetical protein
MLAFTQLTNPDNTIAFRLYAGISRGDELVAMADLFLLHKWIIC